MEVNQKIGTHNPSTGKGDHFRYLCFQNRSLEDRFVIANKYGIRYYGVYDGHGESFEDRLADNLSDNHVVLYIRDNLHHHIFDALGGPRAHELTPDEVCERITNVFHEIDQFVYYSGGKHGCTANIVIILGDKIYQVNLGDSRSVIFDDDGVIISQTIDHKPNNERERIYERGGFVYANRVNGGLAMSRAFGDYEYKTEGDSYRSGHMVISTPEIIVTDRMPGVNFLLGTDGVFDGFEGDNESIIDFFRQHSYKEEFLELMLRYVKTRNYDDDTTVIVGKIH
jgi:serine/threonine protein phosphatase PrpC